MTREELQHYWRYYLLMEKRFIETISYVELHPNNSNTFSNNYALLMQAVGAEMDTVFKLYCGMNADDRKCITDYVNAIDAEENDAAVPGYISGHKFRDQQIHIVQYGMTIQPFKDWDSSRPAQSLSWWDAFDKLKHNRYDNRALSSQTNALNILGALYLLEMKFLKRITEGTDELDIFDEGSRLFTLEGWSSKAAAVKYPFSVLAEMLDKDDDYVPDPVDV